MVRFTLIIPDELNNWLTKQAEANSRSKGKHIRHLLQELKKEQEQQNNGKRPND